MGRVCARVEMVMVVGGNSGGGGDGSQFLLISLYNPFIVSLVILLSFIISMGLAIVHHLFLLM
jgi:hypothetical protein